LKCISLCRPNKHPAHNYVIEEEKGVWSMITEQDEHEENSNLVIMHEMGRRLE